MDIINKVASQHSFSSDFNGRFTKWRFKKFLDFVGERKFPNVLEIGAGEGCFSKNLVKYSEKLVLVEPAKVYFEALKKNFKSSQNVVLHNCLIEDLNIEGFDLVVLAGVLEHVLNTEVFLKTVIKKLNDNGLLFVTVPNATSLHRKIGLKMGILKDLNELGTLDLKVGHQRYYDISLLRSHINETGFSILNEGGVMLKPLPNKDMNNLSDEFIDALYELGNARLDDCAELAILARK